MQALPLVLALAAVHALAAWLPVLRWVPRSRWLSFSGGVAVAFVFGHVLPELDRTHAPLGALVPTAYPAHLVALAGLVVMYAIERVVRRAERRGRQPGLRDAVFWVHVGTFAIYNALIGYVLARGEPASPGLFSLAVGFHFLVNDVSLRSDHRESYERVGRWVLVGAVLAGGVAGAAGALSPAWSGAIFAFVAGGIVLNVLKEELPADREARLWAFVAGAAIFSALMLLVEADAGSRPHP